MELTLCLQAFEKLLALWDMGSAEDKQGMVRMLFEYIEYDLDTKQITDFRLKPWADEYLRLRTALYEMEEPQHHEAESEESTTEESAKSMARVMPPEGFEPPTLCLEGTCSIP